MRLDSSFVPNKNVFHQTDDRVFVSKNAAVVDLLKIVDVAAKTDSPVLITGEVGSGKEFFARMLHFNFNGTRREKPFVRINCVRDDFSRINQANDGTLFFAEVGFLSLKAQMGVVHLFGDARIVASSSQNLNALVQQGKFNAELLSLFQVVLLRIPPLRERREDIVPLAEFFLEHFSSEVKKDFQGFSPEAKKMLMAYYWPGNVRELKNVVERACVLGEGPFIKMADLQLGSVESAMPPSISAFFMPDGQKTLREASFAFKKCYVKSVLDSAGSQTKAAKILGIQRTYLSRLLVGLGIRN